MDRQSCGTAAVLPDGFGESARAGRSGAVGACQDPVELRDAIGVRIDLAADERGDDGGIIGAKAANRAGRYGSRISGRDLQRSGERGLS
jgi:hypothetical protein